jgi:hypothetical protein
MSCYPYEIFINQEMLEDMRCPVCSGVLKDPVMDNCGHSYGRECVKALMLKQQTCPMTQKPLTNDGELATCFPVKSFVSKLKIKCVNYSDCEWEGKVEQLDGHLLNDCLGQIVRCINDGCHYNAMKRNVIEHKMKCQYRPSKCQACFAGLRFLELEGHEEICPEKKLICPFQCNREIKKKNLDFHIENECPEVEVECQVKAFGCRFADKRKRVDEHSISSTGTGQHLTLLIKKMTEWRIEDQEEMKKFNSKLNNIESAVYSIKGISNSNGRPQYDNSSQNNGFQIDEKRILQTKLENSLLEIERLKADAANHQKKTIDAINLVEHMREPLGNKPFSLNSDNTDFLNGGLGFDKNNKGSTISMTSPKEVVSNGIGNIALLNNVIVPGHKYRFKIEKQSAQNFAIGVCIRTIVKNNGYRWLFTDNHGCYFFDANGDQRRNGKFGALSPSPPHKKIPIRTGDTVELLLNLGDRSLTMVNITYNSYTSIDLRDGDNISDLYLAVQLHEKDEAVTLM